MDALGFLGEFVADEFAVFLDLAAVPVDGIEDILRHLLRPFLGARALPALAAPGGDMRRHWSLGHHRGAAKRARHVAGHHLLVVGAAVTEPSLEIMALVAKQLIQNHGKQESLPGKLTLNIVLLLLTKDIA